MGQSFFKSKREAGHLSLEEFLDYLRLTLEG